MQIREWIASQSVLNPMVSAKTNNESAQNSNDVFNQIFESKKDSTSERKPVNLTRHVPIKNFSSPDEKNSSKPLEKSSAENSSNKPKIENEFSKNEDATSKIKPNETTAAEKPSKMVKEDSEITDDMLAQFKDKLKKATGLDDGELEKLMAMLGMGLEAFAQVMEMIPLEALADLEAVYNTLVSLEIGDALDQPMDMAQLESIQKSLEKLVKVLDQASKMPEQSKSPMVNSVIHELTEVANKLKALSGKESVSFAEVQKTMKSESDEKTAPLKAEVKPEVPVTTKANEVTKNQIPENSKVDSIMKEALTKTNESTSKISENVDVDAEKTSTEDMISFHQLVMKQPGMVSQPTVQASQLLRQDVFSQIMDAVKGNIKIDENGTSMLVKLQPEQLGNVELKLNLHKGLVMAEIKVENEIVKAALESNLEDLRQNLANKGYSINQINVTVDSGKKDQQEQFAFEKNPKSKKSKKIEGLQEIEMSSKGQNYQYEMYEESTINYLG
jgi:flagellar hook-length control protein FliK